MLVSTHHGINSSHNEPYIYWTDFTAAVDMGSNTIKDVPTIGPHWTINSAIQSTLSGAPAITLANWNLSSGDNLRTMPSGNPVANVDFEFNMKLLSCGYLEYFYAFFGNAWSKLSFELGTLGGSFPKIVYYKNNVSSYNTYGNVSTVTDTSTYRRIGFTDYSCSTNASPLDIKVEFRTPSFTFYINGNKIFDAVTDVTTINPRLVFNTQGTGTSIQGQISYIRILNI